MKRALLACGALLIIIVLAVVISSSGRRVIELFSYVIETNEDASFDDAEALITYLEAHPDRYALAAWDVGHEDAGIFHDADSLWPLASTVKIIPLEIASKLVASGEWDITTPTPEVEKFYLPGTDGDAHLRANADGGTAMLGGAIHGMIRFSDNAATDALLFRIGRKRLTSTEPGLPTPHPLTGTTMLAVNHFSGDAGIEDAAWSVVLPDEVPTLPIREQVIMTRQFDNRGSARAFARLIERVFSEETSLASTELSWPMEFEGNRKTFKVLATKGGSLPGVLTSASYAETHAGQRRVVALFLHDLPFATWLTISTSYRQQDLERMLLESPDAFERLRPRLGKN